MTVNWLVDSVRAIAVAGAMDLLTGPQVDGIWWQPERDHPRGLR